MSKFSKAVKKMNKAGELLKPERQYSDNPKKAEAEKKLYELVDKVKEEGLE